MILWNPFEPPEMAVLFYSLTLLSLICLTGMFQRWFFPFNETKHEKLTYDNLPVAYITRARWMHLLPAPSYLYTRLPSTFREDVEAGLHSTDFDMTGNVEGDSRGGLDENAKREVLRIMKRRGVNFDEARKIYMERTFKKAGISADGVPNDPKFVSFSWCGHGRMKNIFCTNGLGGYDSRYKWAGLVAWELLALV
jgi:hypothetical protein